MIRLVMMVIVLLLIACSPASIATNALSSLTGGPEAGLEVDTRIAKEANDSVVVGENNRTDIKAESVSITEVVNKNYSMSLLVIAVLGWVLPTPSRMGKWAMAQISLRRKNKNGE